MNVSENDRSAVMVRGLAKQFQLKQKAPGLAGSLRAMWKPEMKEITAVSGVEFTLEEGELLAFIGPNGAGKSTTIKMLTGILFPSAGEATVLGYTPWKDRRQPGIPHWLCFWAKAAALVPPATGGYLSPLCAHLRAGHACLPENDVISWWTLSRLSICCKPRCAS